MTRTTHDGFDHDGLVTTMRLAALAALAAADAWSVMKPVHLLVGGWCGGGIPTGARVGGRVGNVVASHVPVITKTWDRGVLMIWGL